MILQTEITFENNCLIFLHANKIFVTVTIIFCERNKKRCLSTTKVIFAQYILNFMAVRYNLSTQLNFIHVQHIQLKFTCNCKPSCEQQKYNFRHNRNSMSNST